MIQRAVSFNDHDIGSVSASSSIDSRPNFDNESVSESTFSRFSKNSAPSALRKPKYSTPRNISSQDKTNLKGCTEDLVDFPVLRRCATDLGGGIPRSQRKNRYSSRNIRNNRRRTQYEFRNSDDISEMSSIREPVTDSKETDKITSSVCNGMKQYRRSPRNNLRTSPLECKDERFPVIREVVSALSDLSSTSQKVTPCPIRLGRNRKTMPFEFKNDDDFQFIKRSFTDIEAIPPSPLLKPKNFTSGRSRAMNLFSTHSIDDRDDSFFIEQTLVEMEKSIRKSKEKLQGKASIYDACHAISDIDIGDVTLKNNYNGKKGTRRKITKESLRLSVETTTKLANAARKKVIGGKNIIPETMSKYDGRCLYSNVKSPFSTQRENQGFVYFSRRNISKFSFWNQGQWAFEWPSTVRFTRTRKYLFLNTNSSSLTENKENALCSINFDEKPKIKSIGKNIKMLQGYLKSTGYENNYEGCSENNSDVMTLASMYLLKETKTKYNTIYRKYFHTFKLKRKQGQGSELVGKFGSNDLHEIEKLRKVIDWCIVKRFDKKFMEEKFNTKPMQNTLELASVKGSTISHRKQEKVRQQLVELDSIIGINTCGHDDFVTCSARNALV